MYLPLEMEVNQGLFIDLLCCVVVNKIVWAPSVNKNTHRSLQLSVPHPSVRTAACGKLFFFTLCSPLQVIRIMVSVNEHYVLVHSVRLLISE